MRKHTRKEEHFQTVQRVVTQVMLFVIHVENLWNRDRILEPGEHTVEVVDARETNCYIEGKTGEEKNVQYVIKY